jgi:hypothetical protein
MWEAIPCPLARRWATKSTVIEKLLCSLGMPCLIMWCNALFACV